MNLFKNPLVAVSETLTQWTAYKYIPKKKFVVKLKT